MSSLCALCPGCKNLRCGGVGGARLAIRALLKEQLGLSPSEVDVAMKRGLEALLW